MTISRRKALKGLGASGAASLLGPAVARASADINVAGHAVELSITDVGGHIVRISLVPLEGGRPRAIPSDGPLIEPAGKSPVLRLSDVTEPRSVACGEARVSVSPNPL